MAKTLTIVRHAESIGNALGLDDNDLKDTPNHMFDLTEKGIWQARETAKFFENKNLYGKVYCSHYLRTRRTATYTFPNLTQIIDSRLGEVWRGVWYTVSYGTLKEKFPEEVERRRFEGDYFYKALHGESCPEAELRIYSFVDAFLAGDEIQRVVCGHGNWMLLLDRILMNGTPESYIEARKKSPFLNCEIVQYVFNRRKVERKRIGVVYK